MLYNLGIGIYKFYTKKQFLKIGLVTAEKMSPRIKKDGTYSRKYQVLLFPPMKVESEEGHLKKY